MWHIQPIPTPSGGGLLNGVACPAPAACTAVGFTFTSSGGMILAERWNGTAWHIQPTPLPPAAHDISLPAVACPARAACTTVGGFENDGPGSVSLAERWLGSGTPAAQTAPGALSPRAYRGTVGCIRAAPGEGFAAGAAAPRTGPRFKGPMPQQSRLASGSNGSLPSVAWPDRARGVPDRAVIHGRSRSLRRSSPTMTCFRRV